MLLFAALLVLALPAPMAASVAPTMPSAAPKLFYFDFPGKAAGLRLAAAHGGFEIQDHRFKSIADLTAMKESGELPYGQVPALCVDGKILGQSCSIMRYIGKQTGLYPTDPVKAALVDSIMDQEADMTSGITCCRYQERFGFEVLGGAEGEGTKTAYTAIAERVLPRHLAMLERVMQDGGTGWVAGTPEPTIADFTLAPRLQFIASGIDGIPSSCLDAYPGLKGLIGKVRELPAVVAWNTKVTAAGSAPELV
ncbi:glutathione S-transferase [Baffinella frigidus]|nr:glutathione S-transferase [Cryptophyta sp. CCMP2293]